MSLGRGERPTANDSSEPGKYISGMIEEDENGWEEMLPNGISELIKKYNLFGYESEDLVSNRLN